jgi:hypothetical protein
MVNTPVYRRIRLVMVNHQYIFVFNVKRKNFLFFSWKFPSVFKDSPIVEINGGGIINENERLILICHVDSYPSIDYYQWYRNNEKLNISSLASSIIIEKVSKDDAGIYICMVKNTLKYSNGSSIEKFNKTQTKVIVQCKIFSSKFYYEKSLFQMLLKFLLLIQ